MNRYEIWHETPPTFGIGQANEFPDGFRPIAVIEAENVEQAYSLTQHGPGLWFETEHVIQLVNKEHVRSTSVGDLIIGFDEKLVWAVASLGMDLVGRVISQFEDKTRAFTSLESLERFLKSSGV